MDISSQPLYQGKRSLSALVSAVNGSQRLPRYLTPQGDELDELFGSLVNDASQGQSGTESLNLLKRCFAVSCKFSLFILEVIWR